MIKGFNINVCKINIISKTRHLSCQQLLLFQRQKISFRREIPYSSKTRISCRRKMSTDKCLNQNQITLMPLTLWLNALKCHLITRIYLSNCTIYMLKLLRSIKRTSKQTSTWLYFTYNTNKTLIRLYITSNQYLKKINKLQGHPKTVEESARSTCNRFKTYIDTSSLRHTIMQE